DAAPGREAIPRAQTLSHAAKVVGAERGRQLRGGGLRIARQTAALGEHVDDRSKPDRSAVAIERRENDHRRIGEIFSGELFAFAALAVGDRTPIEIGVRHDLLPVADHRTRRGRERIAILGRRLFGARRSTTEALRFAIATTTTATATATASSTAFHRLA